MSIKALQTTVEKPKLERSEFDLSFANAFTGYLGRLQPVYCQEVVPGDYFEIDISHMLDMLPLSGPIVSRLDVYFHAFFIPNRIIWDGWEDFITGRSEDTVPYDSASTLDTYDEESLAAYYGVPLGQPIGDAEWVVNALPLRGYVQIYNDWYRNKVIQDKLDLDNYHYSDKLFYRNWRKDYFTSALPYPQLGDPSTVDIDITYMKALLFEEDGVTTPTLNDNLQTKDLAGTDVGIKSVTDNMALQVHNIGGASFEINDLKFAYAYQDWLTRMLASGDDYGDHLSNIFGVQTKDGRLNRVEYLGGYESAVVVNEVLQTAQDTVEPLGTKAGNAYNYGKSDRITKYCEEHGYIQIIMSVIPKSCHYGGIPKHLLKSVPLDFYFPQFAYLPEQEILNKEVYWDRDDANDITPNVYNNGVFGYIERFAEYKHCNDVLTGDMPYKWDHMHFANIYDSQQALNSTFISAYIRKDALAVQNDIDFWGQVYFKVKAKRPMPFNVDGIVLT